MLEIKVAALLAHRSQYRSTMGIAGDGPSDGGRADGGRADGGRADGEAAADERAAFRDVVEAQLAAHGELAGVPAGEAFRLLTEL
jgi:hypothetical protein